MTLAEAQLAAQEYRFAIARAELGQQVRSLFAFGIAVRDNLALARENEERARELSRIARELVESGKEPPLRGLRADAALRSEEHTSELQSLMRISYAVLCLKKKQQKKRKS